MRICKLCGQETPCCRCDIAQLEMAAKLIVNNEQWRKETRDMQAAEKIQNVTKS